MNFNIENIAFLCEAGSNEYNEDIVGYNEQYFWVIDGATGLNNHNFMPSETDAKWYSNWWNSYLTANAKDDIELKELIRNGITKVKDDFSSELEKNGIIFDDLTKVDYPSASISIVKFYECEAEYLILGDCRIYTDIEDYKKIFDGSISLLDDEVFNSMRRLKNFGFIDLKEIKNLVFEQIVSNRLKNNTTEGYWILSFDESAVDRAKYGKIELKSKTRFMMASDGYYSLSDKYGIYEEDELLDLTYSKGIGSMYQILRDFENDNEKVRFIPRFKKSDDSTCLIFTFVNKRGLEY